MILTLLLPCVAIGWLCGSAPIGLAVGVTIAAVTLVVDDVSKHPRRRRRPRR